MGSGPSQTPTISPTFSPTISTLYNYDLYSQPSDLFWFGGDNQIYHFGRNGAANFSSLHISGDANSDNGTRGMESIVTFAGDAVVWVSVYYNQQCADAGLSIFPSESKWSLNATIGRIQMSSNCQQIGLYGQTSVQESSYAFGINWYTLALTHRPSIGITEARWFEGFNLEYHDLLTIEPVAMLNITENFQLTESLKFGINADQDNTSYETQFNFLKVQSLFAPTTLPTVQPTSELIGITATNVQQVWARQGDGAEESYIFSVDRDSTGNIIVGYLRYQSTGSAAIVLYKYSNNGELLWYRVYSQFTSDPSSNFESMKFDLADDILIGGTDSTGQGFLVKLSADATDPFVWMTLVPFIISNIDVDTQNNIYICGPADTILHIMKLSPNGEIVWQVQRNLQEFSYPISIKVHQRSGDPIIAGGLTTAIFGSESFGGLDYFFCRLRSSDGSVVWSRQLGSSADDMLYSLAIDARGDLYATGYTTSDGLSQLTVLKVSAEGVLLWDKQPLGTVQRDSVGFRVEVDERDRTVYIGGFYQNNSTGKSNLLLFAVDSDDSRVLWTSNSTSSDLRSYITGMRVTPRTSVGIAAEIVIVGGTYGPLFSSNVSSMNYDAFFVAKLHALETTSKKSVTFPLRTHLSSLAWRSSTLSARYRFSSAGHHEQFFSLQMSGGRISSKDAFESEKLLVWVTYYLSSDSHPLVGPAVVLFASSGARVIASHHQQEISLEFLGEFSRSAKSMVNVGRDTFTNNTAYTLALLHDQQRKMVVALWYSAENMRMEDFAQHAPIARLQVGRSFMRELRVALQVSGGRSDQWVQYSLLRVQERFSLDL